MAVQQESNGTQLLVFLSYLNVQTRGRSMQNLCSFSEARNGVCQYLSNAIYCKCAAPNHKQMLQLLKKQSRRHQSVAKLLTHSAFATQPPDCTALSTASHLHQLHSADPSIPSSSHVYLHPQIQPIQIETRSPPRFSPYGAKRDSASASRLPPSCLLLWFKHFMWSPSNTPPPKFLPNQLM